MCSRRRSSGASRRTGVAESSSSTAAGPGGHRFDRIVIGLRAGHSAACCLGLDSARRQLTRAMLATTWVTRQLVFNGVVSGLVIGLLAMGIVLVYRATKVLNFAVGNIGLIGATLLSVLVIRYHVPFWIAAPIALIVGTAFAIAMPNSPSSDAYSRRRESRFLLQRSASPGLHWPSPAHSRAWARRQPATPLRALPPGPMSSDSRSAVPSCPSSWRFPITAILLAWFLNRTTVGTDGPCIGRQSRPRSPIGDQSKNDLDARVGNCRSHRDDGLDPRGRTGPLRLQNSPSWDPTHWLVRSWPPSLPDWSPSLGH